MNKALNNSDGLGGAVSRLTQVNAGEYFDQARNAGSEITDVGDLARLISILPPRFTVQQMQKIMTTKKDGYSLRSGTCNENKPHNSRTMFL